MTTPERRARLLPQSSASGARRRSRHRRPLLLATLFGLMLAPAPFHSWAAAEQKPYALIFGTVFNADGRLVYGVPVKVRRADKKKTLQESMSDHQGEFAFRVPPGPADYIVWVDIKQSKKKQPHDPVGVTAQTQSGTELKVHVDADERVDISLHLPEPVKSY